LAPPAAVLSRRPGEIGGRSLVTLILTETVGGTSLALDFLTRFWALIIAIELAYVALTSQAASAPLILVSSC
jgi:uncharacterized membrane protein YphA (DoxX/SURF4 family)